LKNKHNSRNIACFFSYQFYTEEDYFSRTMQDENPIFGDEKKYGIILNQDAKEYFRKHLEIRFIDENYPATGIARGGYGIV
jgi:hypothetical protein